jgi:DNA polymerase
MFTREELENCTRCPLHKTRTHALHGEGNDNADIMLIAQAPGELEDKENKMFIGPSGKILHKILEDAGIPEGELYMTNLIKCTLPHNRRPKQIEILACSSYLDMEIEKIEPKILVPLGYYATKYIFQKFGFPSFSRKDFPELIGKIFSSDKYRIFPLSHPASLLYHHEFYKNSVVNFSNLRKIIEKK